MTRDSDGLCNIIIIIHARYTHTIIIYIIIIIYVVCYFVGLVAMDTIRRKVGKSSIQGLYPSNSDVGGHGRRVMPFSLDTPVVYVSVCMCACVFFVFSWRFSLPLLPRYQSGVVTRLRATHGYTNIWFELVVFFTMYLPPISMYNTQGLKFLNNYSFACTGIYYNTKFFEPDGLRVKRIYIHTYIHTYTCMYVLYNTSTLLYNTIRFSNL